MSVRRPWAAVRPGPDQVTILVADDEPSVRGALVACLRVEERFALVGSAGTAAEAIRLAARARPRVALVDFDMPGGGRQAVSGILAVSPMTRVVALSGSHDRAAVLGMLRAGAESYLVKGGPPEEIVDTILRAARGECILSAGVAGGLLGEAAAELERLEVEQSARLKLRQRIEQTLDVQCFTPVFQPIFALASGTIVGHEALTRFDPDPQEPQRWFAEAAELGLAVELELAAARAAGRAFAAARPTGYLALNLSPDALPTLLDGEESFGVAELVIEITEHAAIDDYRAIAATLATLRERGVRLAVDDAGAGFASLRHVLELAPDFIKLDLSLTHGIDTCRKRRALASGLIGFARELGATIVAEGIETAAELETLRSLGVRYGQGYYLARPARLPPTRRGPGPLRPRRLTPAA